jgi:hypothetical protein
MNSDRFAFYTARQTIEAEIMSKLNVDIDYNIHHIIDVKLPPTIRH